MTLRLNGSTSGYTEIDAPAVAGSNTLVLPGGNGTAGQVLTTNGSGTLSWADRMTAAGPAFSAYRSTTQSASAGTYTKIQLNTENFDTASAYDSSTNFRFTPLLAGYYLITGAVESVGGAATVIATLYKNGAEYHRGSRVDAANVALNSNFSTVVYMNGSTDFLELYGFTTATLGFAAQWTNMTGSLIRPA